MDLDEHVCLYLRQKGISYGALEFCYKWKKDWPQTRNVSQVIHMFTCVYEWASVCIPFVLLYQQGSK